jgi:hypothetical protein
MQLQIPDRPGRLAAWCLMFAFLSVTPLAAQQGIVTGRVTSTTGGPIPGAT